MDGPLIAIVGRGCVLAGANDPAELWQTVVSGTMHLTRADNGLPEAAEYRRRAETGEAPRTAYGHITRFTEHFDPGGLALTPAAVSDFDPAVQWIVHAARQALDEAGRTGHQQRAGLVLGNITCASTPMAAFAESVWLRSRPDSPRPARSANLPPGASALSRFSFAMPARLTAQALGLRAGGFAIDAACASGLYAIELACRRLRHGQADLMLAGGLNGADPRTISHGMATLEALSPHGTSRPFHRDADGLVLSEGAAVVALMRLEDALATDTPVLAVIRGIGLTNDGGGKGLLLPDTRQQQQAMHNAYRAADVAPASVSYLECHATGTPLGDAVELHSTARVFADHPLLPIGSVKGNIGHPLTASATAGLLKVLGAMEHGILPPSIGADVTTDALHGTPLRVNRQAQEWTGRKRASVSAFGFGGANAHLVLDAWDTSTGTRTARPSPTRPRSSAARHAVALVAVGARVGDGTSTADFIDALLSGQSRLRPPRTAELAVDGLKMPPTDLLHTSAEHVLVLEAARDATAHLTLRADDTVVLVGSGSQPVHAEYALWRDLTTPKERTGLAAEVLPEHQVCDLLQSPDWTLGCLANIAASRISAQLRLTGPSLAVGAEEASGLQALDLAAHAIAGGDCAAAVIGAVDLASTPVHRAAVEELGRPGPVGNAAVVVVLKRLDHARRDGEPVLAVWGATSDEAGSITASPSARTDATLWVGDVEPRSAGDCLELNIAPLFGRPHAATGLLSAACAALALHHRAVPRTGQAAASCPGLATATVVSSSLGALPVAVTLHAADTAPALPLDPEPDPGRKLSTVAFYDLGRILDERHASPHRRPVTLPPPPPPQQRTPLRDQWCSVPANTLRAAALGAHHRAVCQSHQQHLIVQEAAHRLFLDHQGRASRLLLEAARAQGIRRQGRSSPDEQQVTRREEVANPAASPQTRSTYFSLSPQTHSWVLDHCPTWTLPVLPMMSTVEYLLRAASDHAGTPATGLRSLTLKRWIPVTGSVRLATHTRRLPGHGATIHAQLLTWREAGRAALSRFETAAEAFIVFTTPPLPPPLPPLAGAVPAPLPYALDRLPHGPAFQYLTDLHYGSAGARGVLDPQRGSVPAGLTHPGLLDAATHVVPGHDLSIWGDQFDRDHVPYPHGLEYLDLYGPFPGSGSIEVEARLAGTADQLMYVDCRMSYEGRVCAAFRGVSMPAPPSALVHGTAGGRRAFLLERRFVPGMGLTRTTDGTTRLEKRKLGLADWPTGAVAHVYGLPGSRPARHYAVEITMKEHVAHLHQAHPAQVAVDTTRRTAWLSDRPGLEHRLSVLVTEAEVIVAERS
ncbi:beta-ketoacyl synthase N-terminal-like domain-containing protein [Streptomyces sp. NPDC005876]|uniref:hotdog fold thioesterase n=1 Tax=Streptomyces sp. NPDC005876 TaxID=3157076 RepID=UPI0033DBF04C